MRTELSSIRANQTESGSTRQSTAVDRRDVLRFGAGAIAAGLAVPVVTGQAAAHFPANLDVDVKPGSDESPINPRSRGVVPVAVRRTDEFDPTSEPVRYRFGAPDVVSDGGGSRPAGDGHVASVGGSDALVLHFPAAETGFDGDESEARLVWERTESGEHGLSGTDVVTIVGPPA